ncbi:ArnT family glycosyltransferase [Hymenobacter cellulosilyticus]|uniref:Glycosyltransferase family 39 protein n=1 Tax=Hymenobacter cellulosilyticus TaxID=2932248 RepID=A0A8T9QA82_9BACT|nr:glycosyltransferase family 39 protein [Hymenobacter cellulosilyticus]UOQ74434.1 glycosyltransferase family 39 protein [Hymenobacter cellulosilyticus]
MINSAQPQGDVPSTFRYAASVVPVLLLGGLVVRLLFLWVGADVYYHGKSPYINNDTYSFTQSFYNLLEQGIYSFNLRNPEAAFGRLPGYPFFWGAHRLLVGRTYVYPAVAFTQILLDTGAIYLVYATTRALTHDLRAAWVSALLYAGYPFIIVWLTISGSEALGTFMTILAFWWLATRPVTKATAVGAGLLIGLAFMVREYLGILLLGAFFWVYQSKGLNWHFIRLSVLVAVGFLVVYVGWPIRNYLGQHKLVLVKTRTAGYDRYAEDVSTARQWIYGWTTEADPYLDGIAGLKPLPAFPAGVVGSPAEARQIQALIQRVRQCGTGFHSWRYAQMYPRPTNCNAELAAGFTALHDSYKQRHPWLYWFRVPLINLKRAFFKSQLQQGGAGKLSFILFGYRSALLLLGLWGRGCCAGTGASGPSCFSLALCICSCALASGTWKSAT